MEPGKRKQIKAQNVKEPEKTVETKAQDVKALTLQILGVLYKLKRDKYITDKNLSDVSRLTDMIDDKINDILSVVTMMNSQKDKVADLTRENKHLQSKFSETRVDNDILKETCKKLKTDLNSSQEAFNVVFDDTSDFDDKNEDSDQQKKNKNEDSLQDIF